MAQVLLSTSQLIFFLKNNLQSLLSSKPIVHLLLMLAAVLLLCSVASLHRQNFNILNINLLLIIQIIFF
jgi:hypothetical protein